MPAIREQYILMGCLQRNIITEEYFLINALPGRVYLQIVQMKLNIGNDNRWFFWSYFVD